MDWKALSTLGLAMTLTLSGLAFPQEDAEAAMEQAKRLYRAGNFRGAIEPLEEATSLDPTRADALYLLGYSHLMLREYEASVERFRQAFEADPNFDPRTIYQRRPAEGPGG